VRTGTATAAAAGITVLLWASAFVGIRSAGRSFGPGELSLARLTVATVALGVIGVARGERLPSRAALRAAWRPLLVCGLLWFGVYNVALNAGERRVDAGTAAMLVNIGPVLIAVLAGLLLDEGFPASVFGGCAISFTGVAIIAVASSQHLATTTGVLLCLVAALAYSAGVVTQKVALRHLTGTQLIFFCSLIGTVVCLPWSVGLASQLPHASGGSIGWLVYLGVGPTAVGFSTWAFALRRTDAGRLATTTYLVPPLAIAIGWLWLGESPRNLAYAGGALCLLGVAVARRPRPDARAQARALRA
jgi:drug/metabolite transporter (DMT)-like permease